MLFGINRHKSVCSHPDCAHCPLILLNHVRTRNVKQVFVYIHVKSACILQKKRRASKFNMNVSDTCSTNFEVCGRVEITNECTRKN